MSPKFIEFKYKTITIKYFIKNTHKHEPFKFWVKEWYQVHINLFIIYWLKISSKFIPHMHNNINTIKDDELFLIYSYLYYDVCLTD